MNELRVRKVELGSNAHLILTMEDGRVLFINGYDNNYEPWQAGTALGRPERSVIACPGGEIVKNKYANNPGKLAAWLSASHVEKAPKKKETPTP